MTPGDAPWSWSPERLTCLMDTAARFFESHLDERHREHLRIRYGLTDETIVRARIGFAPVARSLLIAHLMLAGFTLNEIRASGLAWVDYKSNARALWSGRLVFPYLVGGLPQFFIARRTDETAEHPGPNGTIHKYKKQMQWFALADGGRVPNGIEEPIFGADTVRPRETLIITEGVVDVISAHQAGYAAVAPVTVQFKEEHRAALIDLCRPAGRIYLIMDSEASGAGVHGAVKTGIILARAGLRPLLCEIPWPEGIEKVDLNDYIRDGGDLVALFERAIDVAEHPFADDAVRREAARAGSALRSATIRDRMRRSPKPRSDQDYPWIDRDEVLAALPPLFRMVGFERDGYGPHPILGSSTGTNLHVTGNQWYFFRAGSRCGGGPLEWIAIEAGFIQPGEKIGGTEFVKTLKYAADRYIPGWRERAGTTDQRPK